MYNNSLVLKKELKAVYIFAHSFTGVCPVHICIQQKNSVYK